MRYQLAGWVLFILCALCFIGSSWINKDGLTFIGSLIFLIACIVFLVELIGSRQQLEGSGNTEGEGTPTERAGTSSRLHSNR